MICFESVSSSVEAGSGAWGSRPAFDAVCNPSKGQGIHEMDRSLRSVVYGLRRRSALWARVDARCRRTSGPAGVQHHRRAERRGR